MSDTQRTAIVTGASAGVGKEAARALLQQGWRVIGIGRDAARCAEALGRHIDKLFGVTRVANRAPGQTAAFHPEVAA